MVVAKTDVEPASVSLQLTGFFSPTVTVGEEEVTVAQQRRSWLNYATTPVLLNPCQNPPGSVFSFVDSFLNHNNGISGNEKGAAGNTVSYCSICFWLYYWRTAYDRH
ncbi:hypothetical protein HYV85_00475 [Candidatus Woesearchaeota archaeon]|nr:hypothetical protein [Candidatus Woesearchaeota archaeon]